MYFSFRGKKNSERNWCACFFSGRTTGTIFGHWKKTGMFTNTHAAVKPFFFFSKNFQSLVNELSNLDLMDKVFLSFLFLFPYSLKKRGMKKGLNEKKMFSPAASIVFLWKMKIDFGLMQYSVINVSLLEKKNCLCDGNFLI